MNRHDQFGYAYFLFAEETGDSCQTRRDTICPFASVAHKPTPESLAALAMDVSKHLRYNELRTSEKFYHYRCRKSGIKQGLGTSDKVA